MRILVFLACVAMACGDAGTAEPLIPLGVEIGDIYTCVIEGVGDGMDAGMDAGADAGMDAGSDGGMDAGVDSGTPDVGMSDAGSDAGAPDSGGVDDGELDPLIRPSCWLPGEVPQRLNLGQPLRGRIFLGDPLCNLADGRLSCLGMNEHGQVGDGTENPSDTLLRVNTPRPVVNAAVNRFSSEGFACALFDNGGVSCWGFGEVGQLGNGLLENRNLPTNVSGVRGGYAIAAGAAHVCVATADEEMGTTGISCWGTGERGQLGDGTSNDSASPIDVNTSAPEDSPFLEATVQLVAGGYHTCALDLDGEIWCWGAGESGQIGNGASVDQARPTRVSLASLVEEGMPEPLATMIAAGGEHTCALTDAGLVACWGSNERLQAGSGGGSTVLTPSTVIAEGATFIAAGRSHSCAIVGEDVQCWGEGLFLGTGTDGDSSTPRNVNY